MRKKTTRVIRRYITTFSLVFLAACSKNTVDRDDLVEREGILYEKFTAVPFSGVVEGKISGVLKDGMWEGTVYFFGEDGNLSIERNYLSGVREGTTTYYTSRGERTLEETFSKGQTTAYKVFSRGVMVENLNFRDTKWHGVQERFWDYSGHLKYRVNYKDGALLDKIIDVYSSDYSSNSRTQLKVPVLQTSNVGLYPSLLADGVVRIVGDETCSVEYDRGHATPGVATEGLKSHRLAECFATVEEILTTTSLKSWTKDS